VFSAASYQYVLYGMGYPTESAHWLLSEANRSRAREKMGDTARQGEALRTALPGNRDLVGRIRKFGLQKI
jgi:tryptophan halogenase